MTARNSGLPSLRLAPVGKTTLSILGTVGGNELRSSQSCIEIKVALRNQSMEHLQRAAESSGLGSLSLRHVVLSTQNIWRASLPSRPQLRRPHQTIAAPYPCTPTKAAGVTDHVWKIDEIVALLH